MKLLLSLFFSLLCFQSVAAQVGRTTYDVTAPAGATSTQELQLTNAGEQPAVWVLTTSPGSWVRLDSERVTVAPGATQTVLFRITVPADAVIGEKEAWIYLESAGKRTPVRVGTFVGAVGDREAAWEIESSEGSGRLVAKKVLRGQHLYLQLALRNLGTLYLTPRFNWTLETTKGEVLQKEPELREAQPAAPGSATVLELRLVPIKKTAVYRLRCRVEEAHDLLPPMEQSIELQLP